MPGGRVCGCLLGHCGGGLTKQSVVPEPASVAALSKPAAAIGADAAVLCGRFKGTREAAEAVDPVPVPCEFKLPGSTAARALRAKLQDAGEDPKANASLWSSEALDGHVAAELLTRKQAEYIKWSLRALKEELCTSDAIDTAGTWTCQAMMTPASRTSTGARAHSHPLAAPGLGATGRRRHQLPHFSAPRYRPSPPRGLPCLLLRRRLLHAAACRARRADRPLPAPPPRGQATLNPDPNPPPGTTQRGALRRPRSGDSRCSCTCHACWAFGPVHAAANGCGPTACTVAPTAPRLHGR